MPARSAFGANGLALGNEVEAECVAYWPQTRGCGGLFEKPMPRARST